MTRLFNDCERGAVAKRTGRQTLGLVLAMAASLMLVYGCTENETAIEQKATEATVDTREHEEEARRQAEETARLEAEAEARRRAEEELRRHPAMYSVEKGDCLWAIAGLEQIYNDPRLWPLIFDANRERIRDPDLIHPEQELTIPRDPSDEQMRERLFELWSELS